MSPNDFLHPSRSSSTVQSKSSHRITHCRPDVHLEDPPAISADLSNCGLVMYGYFIDHRFCQERGFRDNDDASDQIGTCIDELRISAFAKLATFPGNNDIDLFHFALRNTGGPVRTVGNRGVPAIKMKELEAKIGLASACWISFDEVSRELPRMLHAFPNVMHINRAATLIVTRHSETAWFSSHMVYLFHMRESRLLFIDFTEVLTEHDVKIYCFALQPRTSTY